MSYRESEPEAHCWRCHKAVNGECEEFKQLNPQYLGGYDRKFCAWGSKHQLTYVLLDEAGLIVYDSAKLGEAVKQP